MSALSIFNFEPNLVVKQKAKCKLLFSYTKMLEFNQKSGFQFVLSCKNNPSKTYFVLGTAGIVGHHFKFVGVRAVCCAQIST